MNICRTVLGQSLQDNPTLRLLDLIFLVDQNMLLAMNTNAKYYGKKERDSERQTEREIYKETKGEREANRERGRL